MTRTASVGTRCVTAKNWTVKPSISLISPSLLRNLHIRSLCAEEDAYRLAYIQIIRPLEKDEEVLSLLQALPSNICEPVKAYLMQRSKENQGELSNYQLEVVQHTSTSSHNSISQQAVIAFHTTNPKHTSHRTQHTT